MFITRFNNFCVGITVILTLLSLFVYHPEVDILYKFIVLLMTSLLVMFSGYLYRHNKIEESTWWYSSSIVFQGVIFLSLLIFTKMGAYKE